MMAPSLSHRLDNRGFIQVILSPIGAIVLMVVILVILAIIAGVDYVGATQDGRKLDTAEVHTFASIGGTELISNVQVTGVEMKNANLVLHVAFLPPAQPSPKECPSALGVAKNAKHYERKGFEVDSPGSVSGSFSYVSALEEYGSPVTALVVVELSYKEDALFTVSGPKCKAVDTMSISVGIGP